MKTHFFFTGRQAEANSQTAISTGLACSRMLAALLILLGASSHAYAQMENDNEPPPPAEQGLQIYTDEQGNRIMRTTPAPKNSSPEGGNTYYIAPQIYPDSWNDSPSQPGWPGQPDFYPPGFTPGHHPGLLPSPGDQFWPGSRPGQGDQFRPGNLPSQGNQFRPGHFPGPDHQFGPNNMPPRPGRPDWSGPGKFPGAGNQFIPGGNAWHKPGTPGSNFRPGQSFSPPYGHHNDYRPFPPTGHHNGPGSQFRPGNFPNQGNQFRPGYFPGPNPQFRPGSIPPGRPHHGGRPPSHP